MSKPTVKRDKRPEPDDAALFHKSVLDVTPLTPRNKASVRKPSPRTVPASHGRERSLDDTLSDHVSANAGFEPGEALAFAQPGVQRQVLRQLRRGGSAIQDELDLHGLTIAQARPLLVDFLNHCRDAKLRVVRIIHGKGLRSKNREAVLKGKVASWLVQRDEVLAFREAPASEGGSGAVLVLLRLAR